MKSKGKSSSPQNTPSVNNKSKKQRVKKRQSSTSNSSKNNKKRKKSNSENKKAGKKQKIQVAEGQEAEYRAWWADGRLFVERKLDRGLTAVEQYWIQAGTERLHVLTRLEGERLPQTISFVRVYDASAPPGSG